MDKDDRVKQLIEARKQCDLYFKEAIDEARKNQHSGISEEVAAYLLYLMLISLRKDPHSNAESTIKLYLEAFNKTGSTTFRDIGDRSLLIVGMWWESLTRKLVDPDYYVNIGRLSYRKEAEANNRLSELFEELSQNFVESVNILTEATHLVFKKELTHGDVLKIYQRWQETHSNFLETELRKLGINPVYLKPARQ